MINIVVNGETRLVADRTTIRGLVELLGLVEGPVAVERNREVVTRDLHAMTELAEGDVIEIVHFVGGG